MESTKDTYIKRIHKRMSQGQSLNRAYLDISDALCRSNEKNFRNEIPKLLAAYDELDK